MTSDRQIDIIEVDWPISLIELERELGRMGPRETLDVLVRDPDVVNAITMLIDTLPAYHVESYSEGEHRRFHIRKGSGSPEGQE